MKQPQPISLPTDMTIESKCLLISLSVNFATLATYSIGFPLEPYAGQAKALIDNQPYKLGITHSQFDITMQRLAYKIDESGSNGRFIQTLSKALADSLARHQIAYCKYIITELAWLIWKSGSSIPAREVEISQFLDKNIFCYL